MKNNKIVLIGFAACYKTTVGKLLADNLGCSFVDTDAEIERASGLTIQQIFDIHGEEYFRKLEREQLVNLTNCCNAVISCGGGSVLADNFDEFARDSLVVWLTATAETVRARLGAGTRPLFDKLTTKQLDVYIRNRAPLYKQYVQVEISTDGKTPEQVTQEVLMYLCDC